MFLLPACQVSAVSSSNTYKILFSRLFIFFSFLAHGVLLYLCTHIRHTNSSCRLIFCSRSTYYPHSWADNAASKIALRRAQAQQELPSLSPELQLYKISCNLYNVPPQESEPVSPSSLWLAAIYQVFPERNQAICVSQGFGIPHPTQRQFHLRSETDAVIVEVRKGMMC